MVAGAGAAVTLNSQSSNRGKMNILSSACSLVFIQSRTPSIGQNCLCSLWPYTFPEMPSQTYLWCFSTMILKETKLGQTGIHPNRLRTQRVNCSKQQLCFKALGYSVTFLNQIHPQRSYMKTTYSSSLFSCGALHLSSKIKQSMGFLVLGSDGYYKWSKKKTKIIPILGNCEFHESSGPNTHNQLALPQKRRTWDGIKDVEGCGAKTPRRFRLNDLGLAHGWRGHLREKGLMIGGGHIWSTTSQKWNGEPEVAGRGVQEL